MLTTMVTPPSQPIPDVIVLVATLEQLGQGSGKVTDTLRNPSQLRLGGCQRTHQRIRHESSMSGRARHILGDARELPLKPRSYWFQSVLDFESSQHRISKSAGARTSAFSFSALSSSSMLSSRMGGPVKERGCISKPA